MEFTVAIDVYKRQGPGGVVEGKEITMQVKVGDRVLISKYAGTEVKLDGQEYTILRQNDILAIVE